MYWNVFGTEVGIRFPYCCGHASDERSPRCVEWQLPARAIKNAEWLSRTGYEERIQTPATAPGSASRHVSGRDPPVARENHAVPDVKLGAAAVRSDDMDQAGHKQSCRC